MNTNSFLSISDAEKERRLTLYKGLLANPDYENVLFDPEKGGLMVTHKDHCFNIRIKHSESQ